jgi:hypothetical protein
MVMNHLSATLTPRFLGMLLLILLALVLLGVLFLAHAHLGVMPTLAQSTEAILE